MADSCASPTTWILVLGFVWFVLFVCGGACGAFCRHQRCVVVRWVSSVVVSEGGGVVVVDGQGVLGC